MQWRKIKVRIVMQKTVKKNAENCQKKLGLTLMPKQPDPKPWSCAPILPVNIVRHWLPFTFYGRHWKLIRTVKKNWNQKRFSNQKRGTGQCSHPPTPAFKLSLWNQRELTQWERAAYPLREEQQSDFLVWEEMGWHDALQSVMCNL
jgi:hypothetical protein